MKSLYTRVQTYSIHIYKCSFVNISLADIRFLTGYPTRDREKQCLIKCTCIITARHKMLRLYISLFSGSKKTASHCRRPRATQHHTIVVLHRNGDAPPGPILGNVKIVLVTSTSVILPYGERNTSKSRTTLRVH